MKPKRTPGHQDQSNTNSAVLHVKLAAPRGFCAGVERAIRMVETALATYGPPVYVRHEIVHNVHVVKRLKAMGAIFIEDVKKACRDKPLILSAHGTPREVHHQAQQLTPILLDATCPLVQKVHTQARRMADRGYHICLIGHKGHQEVIGTMGQVPSGQITLIETSDDARTLTLPDASLTYVSQTTLSVDETSDIINILKQRFPDIVAPSKGDICYATTNRQNAIKAISPGSDLVVVLGSETSSNSKRMVEVALSNGAKSAILTDGIINFDWRLLKDRTKIGLSSGASVPEELVEEFLTELAKRFTLTVETIETAIENISFKLPTITSHDAA